MKKIVAILSFLLIASTIFAEDYKQIKLHPSNLDEVKTLASIGLDLEEGVMARDGSMKIFVSDSEFRKIQESGLSYKVIIESWAEHYASRPRMTEAEKEEMLRKSREDFNVDGFGYGSMGGYYTLAEIVEKLDEMYTNYPNLITQRVSIGQSHEGREIWMVKISDNPNINEDEPQFSLDGLIHAREPQSMATVMYFMFYLLENYGADPEVTYLVDNREIYCVPCFNPDGYEYNRQTSPGGGGMWRKNRRNSGGGSYGVDLNRNFGYAWGWDNVGSSPDPSSETYRGPSAFSEPESQAIRDFTISKNIKTYINYHSYSDVIIYPWGFQDEETPDSLTYREFGADMSAVNGYPYGYSGAMLGYNSNGTVRDWMYGEQDDKGKIFGYVIELGSSSDGFWPSQSRILPIAQLNLGVNLYKAWVAGEYVKVTGVGFSQQYFEPGDQVEMNAYLRNKGLSTGYNLNFELTSPSPLITIIEGSAIKDSIGARSTDSTDTPLVFQVSSAATVGEPLPLVFTTMTGSTVMSVDTIKIIPGTPTFLFEDNANDPEVMWDIYASPSNPKWDETTATYHSAPNSYTDSKTGEYESNCNVTLTTKDPISLTGINSPYLTFWTKYDIEDSWDAGQVEISTNNGSSWTPLWGNYSDEGSGDGVQTTGEPVYDGMLSEWSFEEIDLSAYEDQDIMIRFELKSDGYIEEDGWYLDDIKIYFYGAGSGVTGCYDISVQTGWNLVSVPYYASSMSLNSIFPDASSQAFYFTTSYQMTETLANDLGYWIKFPAAGNYEVCGQKIDGNISVQSGWNMIGGNDTTIATGDIVSVPSGIIASEYFEFNSGYVIASDIEPGKGYWVRATEPGTIQINSTLPKVNNSPDEKENWTAVTFEDAAGNRSVLYLIPGSEEAREMPPMPPAGVFDIRYASGNYAESYNAGGNVVNLSSVTAPVKISVSNGSIFLPATGERVTKENPAVISELSGNTLTIMGNDIPSDYQLAQNYPNPFNPGTKIKFALPVNAKVTVNVYDILGRKVAGLVDKNIEAGRHEVNFNASNLTSGVYIYKIEATGTDGSNYSNVMKMMLLK